MKTPEENLKRDQFIHNATLCSRAVAHVKDRAKGNPMIVLVIKCDNDSPIVVGSDPASVTKELLQIGLKFIDEEGTNEERIDVKVK